ncbi:diguanylate cyclase (GGDEF)-like protein [Mesorhizobium soli]|jgi:diguanylate cyclase (GGDEF)-like protein|uniref:GGDEF domain-containing protein n=1 Tax=Pseudaminobacter soli (ex Li et al. 2025) TaxID=1295366 RepID=UPI002474CABB|nr:GGDEF domain-containing protein [Mesorhizobium soli]MDH6230917.1 diguanylate cyclase (GGDEF)-like protein [Mesorhizobium soli]
MTSIILRASLVSILAVAGSLLVAVTVVPMMGGTVDGNAWLMCIVCPLATAFPASAYTFWQSDRLKHAHRELERAHAQLAATHRRLAEKASRDDMTGMLNRETFFASLDGSRRRSDRGALLIIDADHFKKINDNFGHLTGDEALLEIAAAISRGVRSGDILGRIGGEEFGAFLIGATEQEAAVVAERIRREVEKVCFKPAGEQQVPLTVSIGGTVCALGATVSELMRAADRRLYEAKNRGRNLTIVAGLPSAA